MKYETELFGGQNNLHCMKQTLQDAKSNSHGGIRLCFLLPAILIYSEKLSHVTLFRNLEHYFST